MFSYYKIFATTFSNNLSFIYVIASLLISNSKDEYNINNVLRKGSRQMASINMVLTIFLCLLASSSELKKKKQKKEEQEARKVVDCFKTLNNIRSDFMQHIGLNVKYAFTIGCVVAKASYNLFVIIIS